MFVGNFYPSLPTSYEEEKKKKKKEKEEGAKEGEEIGGEGEGK